MDLYSVLETGSDGRRLLTRVRSTAMFALCHRSVEVVIESEDANRT